MYITYSYNAYIYNIHQCTLIHPTVLYFGTTKSFWRFRIIFILPQQTQPNTFFKQWKNIEMSSGLSVTQICILCYELLQPRIGNIKHDENAPFFNEIPYTNHTNPPQKTYRRITPWI